jgi:hypothetical protein
MISFMEFLFYIQTIFARFINLEMVLPVVWRSRAISKQNKRPVSAEKFAQSLHILRGFLNVNDFYKIASTNKACHEQLSLTDRRFYRACKTLLETKYPADIIVCTRNSMMCYTKMKHNLLFIKDDCDENQEYFCYKMSSKASILNGVYETTMRSVTDWDFRNRRMEFAVTKYTTFDIQSSKEIVTFA